MGENGPKFPQVEVELDLKGEQGNAFVVMGMVTMAMRKAKIPKEEIDAYMEEATSGTYENLLRVTKRTVTLREE